MKAEKIIRLRIQNSTFCRRIRVVQGDTGRIFRFILEDITMDGSEQARVYAKKPDGTEVYNDCEVVSPNEVLMESDSGQIFAAIGVVQAEIQISKSGKTITTYTFEFDVEKSLTRAGAIQSSSEYGALETAITKAEGFYNPTFYEAATRNNINSGESIPTLFGKVKKWFTDLNALIRLVGNADISGIGKGTVTDALLTLNSKAESLDIGNGKGFAIIPFSITDGKKGSIELENLSTYKLIASHASVGSIGEYIITSYEGGGQIFPISKYAGLVVSIDKTSLMVDAETNNVNVRTVLYRIGYCG